MKTIKKLMTLVLSIAMILAMSVTAFAADSTPVDVSKHKFDAYQIFSGTWDSTSKKLTNIVWGNGVNGSTLLMKLKEKTPNPYTSCESAADVAEVVSGFGYDSDEARAFAVKVAECKTEEGIRDVKNGQTIAAGYYLIVDITSTSGQVNAAKNLSLLTVGTTVTIQSKSSYPTVTKKVRDINDSTENTIGNLQDSADYDFGDQVPFTLTGTLPSDYDSYSSYKYVFHDVQSAGLDFPNNIVVKVGDKTLSLEDAEYEVKSGSEEGNDKCTFEIEIKDLKKVAPDATAASKVVVTYNARLNDQAVIGAAGNPNEVYLEYSNNPNAGGSGETGKTPKDKVIVFTYKVVANKVDQNQQPLTGAAFELFKLIITEDKPQGEYVSLGIVGGSKDTDGNVIADGTTTKFEWSRLDDGQYKIVEVATPAGYNSIPDQEFTVAATHDENADNPELKKLSGDKVTGSVIKLTPTQDKSGLDTTIVNKSGSTLPSTGGMGTTIFYVVGTILVLAAVVLLITKKRMHADK